VVVKTVQGEVLAKEIRRLTARAVELRSLNPDYPDRVVLLAEVAWIARILWSANRAARRRGTDLAEGRLPPGEHCPTVAQVVHGIARTARRARPARGPGRRPGQAALSQDSTLWHKLISPAATWR
ncbi:MAG: S24 family peptidase, partial [Caulobacteraceae bacterium]